AEDQLRRGETYASIIIPKNFTADLLAITEGTVTQPTLEYRDNEKSSAIAPPVTDTGDTAVHQAITAALKQENGTAARKTIIDEGKYLDDAIMEARDATSTANGENAAKVRSARAGLDDLTARLSEAESTMTGAEETVNQVYHALVAG